MNSQIYILNNKFKQFKTIYFASDEFTCQTYKFSTKFDIKSSGEKRLMS